MLESSERIGLAQTFDEWLEEFRVGKRVEYWRDDDLHCLSWRSARHPNGVTCRGLTIAEMMARADRTECADEEHQILLDLERGKWCGPAASTLPSPPPDTIPPDCEDGGL